jgi:RepB DNA-primase from phage plasmid
MTDDARQPDLKAAADFLDLWHGSEPKHLTAIVPDQGNPVSRTFAKDEHEQLTRWCDEQQRRGAGLYYHVNVLNGSPRHGKANKNEVHSARGAHVEIDLKDNFRDLDWQDDNEVAGATAMVLERLKDFPVTPTFVVLSGGGVQAGWRFDAPVKLNGGQTTARIETLNLALALHFGGDKSVRDTSRILRVPGTINFPNAKKRQLGRGQSISSCPILFDNAVNPKTLWQTIPETARTAAEAILDGGSKKSTKQTQSKNDRAEPLNVEAWINGLDDEVLHIVSNAPKPDVDRSRMCFRLLLRLIRMNVPDEVAVELRQRYPDGPLGHYTSDKQLRDDLVRAHAYARTHGFEASAVMPAVAPDEPAIPAIVEPQPGDEFPLEELGPGLAAMTVLTTLLPDDAAAHRCAGVRKRPPDQPDGVDRRAVGRTQDDARRPVVEKRARL